MVETKYIILARYECWASNGKSWTNWFVHDSTPMLEDEASNVINITKKAFAFIDQKTKLKHEYMLKDYTEYKKEQSDLLKDLEEMNDKQNEYFKSAEYKELQNKKRQAAKERKERQKKYAIEHGIC